MRIAPELAETYTLMAMAYEGKGDSGTAAVYRSKALEAARRIDAARRESPGQGSIPPGP